MNTREPTDLPDDKFPDDPWALVEDAFAPRFLYLTETIFALSNGRIGVRGTHDEGAPTHVHGTFVNRFYETWPILHPEKAYGLATTGQTIVNVPDATVLEISVDGVPSRLDAIDLEHYRRWVDFRTGTLNRHLAWRTQEGTKVSVTSARMVSYDLPELMAFATRIEVDRPAVIELRSRLINRQDRRQASFEAVTDPRRAQDFPHKVLNPRAAEVGDTRLVQGWVTTNSGKGLLTAVEHVVRGTDPEIRLGRDAEDFSFSFRFHLDRGEAMELDRFAAYVASDETPTVSDRRAVAATLDAAAERGFKGLADGQRRELEGFWARADIEVGAGPEIQQAVRWVLFQLHQASVRLKDGSIPAKGLTGQAYDGHYFWDNEIYVHPFLVYAQPESAAEVLRFRYSILDAARRRARELSHPGALFPWRTITGEEASAYFLAGTAQYHIDADIVYALRKYVEVTGDDELLWDIGVELAVETARMWMDLGSYHGPRFHIHGVTGPDEYTALVDDNAYTNAMARMNLRYAFVAVSRMREEQPDRFRQLASRLELGPNEATSWRTTADTMYLPFDEDLGITPQDDDFLSKEPWDFENTPASKYPLLLHFHPLVIYRHQALKQADVVLADFLLGDEFPLELKKANFDFYDPITTGDSSLSACVQAIMAAEIGYPDVAMEHFQHALFMDLADLAGNTTDGVHMASAGGVWMALVFGFGGLRDHGGRISFDPRLPAEWSHLRYRIGVRGRHLAVTVDHEAISFELDGDPIEVSVRGIGHRLDSSRETRVRLR